MPRSPLHPPRHALPPSCCCPVLFASAPPSRPLSLCSPQPDELHRDPAAVPDEGDRPWGAAQRAQRGSSSGARCAQRAPAGPGPAHRVSMPAMQSVTALPARLPQLVPSLHAAVWAGLTLTRCIAGGTGGRPLQAARCRLCIPARENVGHLTACPDQTPPALACALPPSFQPAPATPVPFAFFSLTHAANKSDVANSCILPVQAAPAGHR